MRNIRYYKDGTSLITDGPWSIFVGGRALCPDGKVRALSWVAQCADSYWTVPAAVKVKGKKVSGFVTFKGFCDDYTLEFVPMKTGKNAGVFDTQEVPAEG
jgi:hypothetical protein